MADLFDALAARALGTAATLVPTPVPRFAPVHDQLPDSPVLVSADSPTPAPQSGPRPGRRPVRTPADDAPVRVPRALDEPREMSIMDGREAAPIQEAPGPDPEVEQPSGAARRHRRDDAGSKRAAAEADSRPAPRGPRRGPRDGVVSAESASPPGPPAAEPATGRRRAAVARQRSRDAETGSRPRPPYELDDRSTPRPAAPAAPSPQVTVSIGYVEVRAPAGAPEPRTAPRTPRPEPRLSLQDYLHRDGRR